MQKRKDWSVKTITFLLVSFAKVVAEDAAAWEWSGSMPCDIVFVKGKKVAGTTVGGVMRRIGLRKGIDFFSPQVPERKTVAWRSGGRERWVLEDFGRYYASRKAEKRHFIGWAQEQSLSPRRAGLEEFSVPLKQLSESALRITVLREPVAHALSACSHFGPCAAKTKGAQIFQNRSAQARLDWIANTMGPIQMWRFITPWPEATADIARKHLEDVHQPRISTHRIFDHYHTTQYIQKKRNLTQAAVDYYHIVLLADEIDVSLVAMAMVLPQLELSDVLYMSAKTTHTGRRPPKEPQPHQVLTYLDTLFYGDHASRLPPLIESLDTIEHNFSTHTSLAPDTELYLRARARLRNTILTIGKRRFLKELHRFHRMQKNMLAACTPRRKKKEDRRRLSDTEDTYDDTPSRLPSGISPRALKDCLYGDQGCGYRCIDAWVADRQRRLARTGRSVSPSDRIGTIDSAHAPPPDAGAEKTKEKDTGRDDASSSLTSSPQRPIFLGRKRKERNNGKKIEKASSNFKSISQKASMAAAAAASPVRDRLTWEQYRPDPNMLNNMEV